MHNGKNEPSSLPLFVFVSFWFVLSSVLSDYLYPPFLLFVSYAEFSADVRFSFLSKVLSFLWFDLLVHTRIILSCSAIFSASTLLPVFLPLSSLPVGHTFLLQLFPKYSSVNALLHF